MFLKLLILALALAVSAVMILVLPGSSSSADANAVLVQLDAAPGWTTRSTATGSVLIFFGPNLNQEFDLHVMDLRPRGTAFGPAEQELEAVRFYEFLVNGQALMRFNTGRRGFSPDGIGGGIYYTNLSVARNALDFSVEDPLNIEVRLQPDNVLALIGTKP